MAGTNGLKETPRVTVPVASDTPASNTLSVNVFTAPGKAMVGEETPDEGAVSVPKKLTIGGLARPHLTRHGMPHPWQFHGWAAANSPWHVHRS